MQYRKKRKKKDPNWIPKPITVKQVEWASDKYLERYIATEMQLRRVLKRRLLRNWRARGDKVTEEEKQMGEDLVSAQVKKVMDSGRIKDDKVALMWVEHFTNRGKSAPFIRMKLREKGVGVELIDDAIAQVHDQMQDPALEAAVTYARKRRLGAYRRNEIKQAERKQKDIAAMVRAGHRYDVVRRVMDCTTIDEVESLIDEGFWD